MNDAIVPSGVGADLRAVRCVSEPARSEIGPYRFGRSAGSGDRPNRHSQSGRRDDCRYLQFVSDISST
jgi:hypothetical protein